MTIKNELLRLQQADPNNVLHADQVVEWAAENPKSALYKALEWNDRKAANEYRLWQVRHLIQIHVVTEEREPLLVNLSIDRTAGGGYRSISDVVKVPSLRDIMLEDALRELFRVQVKYERVEELNLVWQEAERVRSRVSARKSRKETVPA